MLCAKKMLEIIDIVALAGPTSCRSLDPSESSMHVQIVTSDSVGHKASLLKRDKLRRPWYVASVLRVRVWVQNLQTWNSPTDQRMPLTCLELRKESGLFLRSIFPGCG